MGHAQVPFYDDGSVAHGGGWVGGSGTDRLLLVMITSIN